MSWENSNCVWKLKTHHNEYNVMCKKADVGGVLKLQALNSCEFFNVCLREKNDRIKGWFRKIKCFGFRKVSLSLEK